MTAAPTWRANEREFFADKQPLICVLADATHDVVYSELVREPETSLRKMFDFGWHGWVPGRANLPHDLLPSAILSAAQVRTSLDTTRAFGAWRRYESQLSGLVRTLPGLADGDAPHEPIVQKALRAPPTVQSTANDRRRARGAAVFHAMPRATHWGSMMLEKNNGVATAR